MNRSTTIVVTITTTADAVTIESSQLLPMILQIAQTAMMGAFIMTCNPMATNI